MDGSLFTSSSDIRIRGRDGHRLGGETRSVVSLGDVDGDGTPDLLVGAIGDNTNEQGAGAVFLFTADTLTPDADVLFAEASIYGQAYDEESGTAAAAPGDVNGDGFADLLWTAPMAARYADTGGAAYLMHGPITGHHDVGEAVAFFGGADNRARFGVAAWGGGDLTGDGVPDLLFGAPEAAGGAQNSGAAYVVPGPTE